MQRRDIGVALGASVATALSLWAAASMAQTPRPPLAQPPDVYSLRGRFTIQMALEPAAGAAASDWCGPIKDVDEITLLQNFAIIRKAQNGTAGTLIVPTSKLLYINVGEER